MERFFNTSGPCDPAKHYMLPAEERLSEARRLIELERYFVLHAPRQTGKTTTVAALTESLAAEGRYAALLASCEEAQAAGEDINRGIAAILNQIEKQAADLPEPQRPPPVETVADVDGVSRLGNYLTRWAERSPLPVVLFLDEIDSVMGNPLISVLRQLRAGYPDRPARFPQTVALVGMRDVRDYKLAKGQVLHTASPYNIKDRSFLLGNFTAEEVATLYEQHTAETGQVFTAEVKAGAWELTQGQPWLVNALADQVAGWDVADRSVVLDISHIESARETLIARRDTHLDSLVARLHEQRLDRVLAPILAGDQLAGVSNDDLQFVKDLGLVTSDDLGACDRQPDLPGDRAAGLDRGDGRIDHPAAPVVSRRRRTFRLRAAARRLRRFLAWERRGLSRRRALFQSRGAARLHGLPAQDHERQRARRRRPGVRRRARASRPLHPLAASRRWLRPLGDRAQGVARQYDRRSGR